MRASKLVFALGAGIVGFASLVTIASASHDPCKVLTAKKFGQIMGYAATINKTASNQANCYYNGAGVGGQFHILTENASPQADAILNRRGSAPPPGSGLIGGTYRQGRVIFAVSIQSNNQAKLQALVAEIRRNLK